MKWQDTASTVVNLVFIGALFPSLIGKNKPALWTSALTALGLAVWALVCFSLKLWWTGTSELAATSMWMILAWQARKQRYRVPS